MLKSSPPVITPQSRFMIIGSMPGKASLEAQEYYAYKHNAFWPIIFDVFAPGRAPADYADKLQTLLQHGGALWDTLAACRRSGSLDVHIRDGKPNNFIRLFKQYPAVKTLLFNGLAAHQLFVRHFGQILGKTYLLLPSTSPANAALSYPQKLAIWTSALQQACV